VFGLQREAYLRNPYPSLAERTERLRILERILLDNVDAIAEAINADFGHRATEESQMLEIFTCVDGIRHTVKKLPKWMKPQRRQVSVLFATASNRVVPQPKGVVGIVSPWNYPLFLTVSPLTGVLAAGNRAMIKMASSSQHLCRLLTEKLRAALPEEVAAILPGVRAQDFSTLPYDHLIFTGSADAGRTVMRAAAEHLTPVTLELGGKSPTIVCDDFDVEEAASRIMYGKLINAGQTCLAPTTSSSPRPCATASSRRPGGSSRSATRHERPQLHLGDRRALVPPAARHPRGRAAEGGDAGAARARRHVQRPAAQDPAAPGARPDRRHAHPAGRDLRAALPREEPTATSTR